MRLHIIIHAPFEKAGLIDSWTINQDHDLSSTQTYKSEKLPDASTIE